MTTTTSASWTRKGYQRMSAARYQGGRLHVQFEDGSSAILDAESVLPAHAMEVDWDTLQFDPYELTLSSLGGIIEVPSTTIRALSDSAYSAHLAEVADEQARQIGVRLRELRTQRHLTSKDLAARAGISPQSLSRIENGHHDVVFSTLQRILAAMGCRLQDLATKPASLVEPSTVVRRLTSLGLDADFVTHRLQPEPDLSEPERSTGVTDRFLQRVTRIFDWDIPDILSNKPLALNPAIAQAGRFKSYGRAEEAHASAYTVYAHYLALLLVQASAELPIAPLSGDARVVRGEILEQYGALTFEQLVRYAWDRGVPVLPLHDAGAFHGACWRIGGRPAIVLKQSTDSQSRWCFDLAHEWKHAADHLTEQRPTLIEDTELTPIASPRGSHEEQEASRFAGSLVLFDRAEELAQQSVALTGGIMSRLKRAVQQVSEQEQVPVDALANYLAFRLSAQGENWWGAANNLQVTDPTPWAIARNVMLEHININVLQDDDRALLLSATAA